MVRVRFGGAAGQRHHMETRRYQRHTRIIVYSYIERVVTDRVLVPESMRDDITRIADAYGGTRANILRLAVPPARGAPSTANSNWPRVAMGGKARFSHVVGSD